MVVLIADQANRFLALLDDRALTLDEGRVEEVLAGLVGLGEVGQLAGQCAAAPWHF